MPFPRKRRRQPLEPATGTVKILRPVGEVNATTGEVQISAKAYYLSVFPGGYHLTGWDERQARGHQLRPAHGPDGLHLP